MRAHRLFVSAAAIALVAGPGLAMAQNGPPSETPPVETPPVTEAPEETPPIEAPPVETPEEDEVETRELDTEEAKEVEADELEAEEDGEGDGATISALAECLPSGAELHGTGFNKGFIMRQAASGGEVKLGEGDEALTVESPEDAAAVCAVVQDLADQAEAPDTAKGRPDWAGPKDKDRGDVSTSSGDRGGPPAHANAGGNKKGGGPNGS